MSYAYGSVVRKNYSTEDYITRPRSVPKIESSRPVKSKSRIKSKFIFRMSLVFGLSVAICLGHVITYNQHYQISNHKKQLETLKNENQHIVLEISNLSNLNRIQEVATNELQMQKITPNRIINLNN